MKHIILKWFKDKPQLDNEEMERMNHAVNLAMAMVKDSKGNIDLDIALPIAYNIIKNIEAHFKNDG